MGTPLKIGIIGGMGPEATVLLMQKIIKATMVKDDIDHIPMIVDNNPQIPSRINALIHGTGPSPAPVLARMASNLEGNGAKAIVMPCNTAHHYASDITNAISIPFLNMLDLCASALSHQVTKGEKIGILASPATCKLGLYDKALSDVGLKAIYPEDQDAMLKAIHLIKKNGPTAETTTIISSAARELNQAGASCSLVGCSEFSLVTEAITKEVVVLDGLDILVGAIIAFATPSDKSDMARP